MTDEVFDAISHPIRIRLLKALTGKPIGFADLKRQLKIDSSGQLDFHLKKMQPLIDITDHGLYTLNSQGYAALTAVGVVSKHGWQRRALILNIVVYIILNLFMLSLVIQGLHLILYLIVFLALTAWILFYGYWNLVKRRVQLKDESTMKYRVKED
ncbi:MAG: helix-turn-helix domain-containing protein [Candidatus Lokiarchaeota archaeon]|nr:helix-turn-helix domain-containing protein [Candidatus Lokiarchaeota archaeon]